MFSNSFKATSCKDSQTKKFTFASTYKNPIDSISWLFSKMSWPLRCQCFVTWLPSFLCPPGWQHASGVTEVAPPQVKAEHRFSLPLDIDRYPFSRYAKSILKVSKVGAHIYNPGLVYYTVNPAPPHTSDGWRKPSGINVCKHSTVFSFRWFYRVCQT